MIIMAVGDEYGGEGEPVFFEEGLDAGVEDAAVDEHGLARFLAADDEGVGFEAGLAEHEMRENHRFTPSRLAFS